MGDNGGGDGSLDNGVIAGIAAGGAVGLLLILLIAFLCVRKVRRKPREWLSKKPALPVSSTRGSTKKSLQESTGPTGPAWVAGVRDPGSVAVTVFEKPLLNLTLADLMAATSCFGEEAEVDGGGYKCDLPGVVPEGTQAVVKVVEGGGGLAEEALRGMRHENLVPLLGFCTVGPDRRLLIYKLAQEERSLNEWLHSTSSLSPSPSLSLRLTEGTLDGRDRITESWDTPEGEGDGEGDGEGGGVGGDGELGWKARIEIAMGVARALAFLHHGCVPPHGIAHGDVSSRNILLDNTLHPRLAGGDFYTPTTATTTTTVTTTRTTTSTTASIKADVFSFGVLLLELVTGKNPTRHPGLVPWVRRLIRDDHAMVAAIDPRLTTTNNNNDINIVPMLETLRIGYYCTAECASKRLTMQQVKGLLKELIDPSPSSTLAITAQASTSATSS